MWPFVEPHEAHLYFLDMDEEEEGEKEEKFKKKRGGRKKKVKMSQPPCHLYLDPPL